MRVGLKIAFALCGRCLLPLSPPNCHGARKTRNPLRQGRLLTCRKSAPPGHRRTAASHRRWRVGVRFGTGVCRCSWKKNGAPLGGIHTIRRFAIGSVKFSLCWRGSVEGREKLLDTPHAAVTARYERRNSGDGQANSTSSSHAGRVTGPISTCKAGAARSLPSSIVHRTIADDGEPNDLRQRRSTGFAKNVPAAGNKSVVSETAGNRCRLTGGRRRPSKFAVVGDYGITLRHYGKRRRCRP